MQFTFLGLLFIRPGETQYVISDWAQTLTSVLTIIATIILFWAIINLRPALRVSPIPKPGAPLVRSGIYKWISHPMYLAVTFYGLSMFLSHINIFTGLFLFSLVIVLKTKANMEENLLSAIHATSNSPGLFPIRGI